MSVEAATFIADLQPTNPPATDPRSQGDDHLRLIKSVLQNTFSGASRQIQVPGIVAVSAAYAIQKSDGESTIYCSTGAGALNLTLPLLVAGDRGWRIFICKTTSDVNPVFVAASSGNVSSGGVSVAKARRCVPGARIAALWDGANWFIERTNRLPIGSIVTYWGSVLPAGFEWPNGQTLAPASYPEYATYSSSGATIDMRGYADVCLDNLGGAAAGRLPDGYINGSALGATGGVDGVTLSSTQMPSHYHYAPIYDPGHAHNYAYAPIGGQAGNQAGWFGLANNALSATGGTSGASTGIYVNGAAANYTAATGGGAMHSNLQPSVMMGKIMVVE